MRRLYLVPDEPILLQKSDRDLPVAAVFLFRDEEVATMLYHALGMSFSCNKNFFVSIIRVLVMVLLVDFFYQMFFVKLSQTKES